MLNFSDTTDAVPLGRRVARAAVLGAVANHEGAGWRFCEVQHLAKQLRVVFLARGDHAGDHEGGRWINPEMDFAVRAALQTMDGGQPDAGTADLQPVIVLQIAWSTMIADEFYSFRHTPRSLECIPRRSGAGSVKAAEAW